MLLTALACSHSYCQTRVRALGALGFPRIHVGTDSCSPAEPVVVPVEVGRGVVYIVSWFQTTATPAIWRI